MSKKLLLVRHAKSSWKEQGQADFDRPLNDRGVRDAPVMGHRLKERGVEFDKIVCSPAKRTTQTIKFICKEIGYDLSKVEFNKMLYAAHELTYLDILKSADNDYETIAYVGHNPSTEYLADILQSEVNVSKFPTCGMICIEFNCATWQEISSENAKLLFFDYPKNQPI